MTHFFNVSRMALCRRLCCLCLVCLVLAGCAGKKTRSYDDGELRPVQAVLEGTVLNAGQTRIKEDPSLFGPIAGGVAGGVVGAVIASSPGAVVGATAGAILGGSDDTSRKTYLATELTVELENGAVMLMVLGNNEYFVRGDPVRIISLGDSIVRVQHK